MTAPEHDPAPRFALNPDVSALTLGPVDTATTNTALLQAARGDFPLFYSRGTMRDRALLDMLVLMTSLVVTLNAHRKIAGTRPTENERTWDAAQDAFIDLRERVRSCPTFNGLPLLERWKMESTLFQRGSG